MADYFLKDHKPSALRSEARLRGQERNNYSKTISPRLSRATPACAGCSDPIGYRLSAIDYRLSPIQGEARLRRLAK